MFKVNDKDTRKRKVNDKVKNKDTVDVYTGREGGAYIWDDNWVTYFGDVYLGGGTYMWGKGCINGILR